MADVTAAPTTATPSDWPTWRLVEATAGEFPPQPQGGFKVAWLASAFVRENRGRFVESHATAVVLKPGPGTLTSFLHATQPLARLVGRIGYGLAPWRWRRPAGVALPRRRELAAWREDWRPPEDRLCLLLVRRWGRLGAASELSACPWRPGSSSSPAGDQ